jgi:para-aminobenzoate synthetase/4-amino-4-deoxychorismate lyase
VDEDGSVLEASWANVWACEGTRLVTPPADGRLLPGTARARLLQSELETAEEPLTLARLEAADVIVLTSALRTEVAELLHRARERPIT